MAAQTEGLRNPGREAVRKAAEPGVLSLRRNRSRSSSRGEPLPQLSCHHQSPSFCRFWFRRTPSPFLFFGASPPQEPQHEPLSFFLGLFSSSARPTTISRCLVSMRVACHLSVFMAVAIRMVCPCLRTPSWLKRAPLQSIGILSSFFISSRLASLKATINGYSQTNLSSRLLLGGG